MNELWNQCKSLVNTNLTEQNNEEYLYALYSATLALLLIKPKLTLSKLPNILQSLNIIIGNETTLELATKNIEGFVDDGNLEKSGATIIRQINYDDEKDILSENKYLVFSTNNQNISKAETVMKLIHEFFHLLRHGGISKTNTVIKDIEGISINRFNLNTGTMKRKHFQFEEAIVQSYTDEALKLLNEYLNTNNNLPSYLNCLKIELQNFSYSAYYLHLYILNMYKQNPKINVLIDESFENFTTPSSLAQYINDVMDSPSAFSRVSKKLDNLIAIQDDKTTTDNEFNNYLNEIKKEINEFLLKIRYTYKK